MALVRRSMLLAGAVLLASPPALADAPSDQAVLEARCLVKADATAKASGYKDMQSMMYRGLFVGRIIARSGEAAGKLAVAAARKDAANPALMPSDDTCKAAVDTILGRLYVD